MSDRFQWAPGRVKLDSVNIIKPTGRTDVTSLIVEVNVYSSIIDTSNVAKFQLLDAKNILSNLPIEAGDKFELNISYPEETQSHKFIASQIIDIEDKDKQKVYTVECVSELAFVSFYRNFSKHYKGTTSDIAYSIFTENTTEKFGIWEQSLGVQSLIVPNWDPLKTIKWLATRSTSAIDTTRFLFFQDSRQKYHFAPIERFRELYKNAPALTYTYRKNNQLNEGGVPNSEAAMQTIEDITFHDAFDIYGQIKTGKLGGLRYEADLNTKTFSISSYNYWEDFKKENRLNGYPSWRHITDGTTGKIIFDHVLSNMTTGIQLNKVSDQSNIKVSSLDKSQMVTIVVKGNMTADVGQVIQINIPSAEPKSDQIRDQFDQRWSGKYYIVAKRDLFTKEGKQTALQCSKESLTSAEVV